ncbi:MAG TPA: hypothetical protein VFI31_25845 [Pirellulales bacterium]|nr:hypothetical protein [Pirellulales bacterium]
MVTSGYVTLAGFLAVVQLAASAWAIVVGVRSLAAKTPADDEAADRLESRTYLAGLLAYLLLGTSLASWAVLYLLLDSFVPQWKGAMCIYGVTQIGEGSRGMYSWLPKLVFLEQALKPLLILSTGAALVLYRFYRRLETRTLLPRVAASLLLASVLASLDAAVELTYLAIPKRESLPNSGCCSVSSLEHEREPLPSPREQGHMELAYYAGQALMALLVWRSARRATAGLSAGHLLFVVALGALALAVSMQFLIHVASPALLHLPYHHCIYDLVAQAPEAGVALALLLWGTFCVGWAATIGWLGRCAESAAELGGEVRSWLAYALLGYLGSTAMMTLDLWLA